MFEDLAVTDVFPTPIWTVDLKADAAAALNARLLRAIDTLLNPRPPLPAGANWQTDPTLHQHPDFDEVTKLAERAGRAAARFLKLKDRDLVVTGLWANVNPPGGRNSHHTHPNNYLSGVYYVSTPGNEGRIVFDDPRAQARVMMPPITEFTAHNGNTITFDVKPGRMVLFPAWLTHSVPVNASGHDRISIAFNLMFRDYVEHASPALWKGTVRVKEGSKG